MRSRIVSLNGKNDIEVNETNIEIKDNEILVKTHQGSICGTDKNLYLGFVPPTKGILGSKKSYPIVSLGHEGGGTVVEVGSKVTGFKEGDKVMSVGMTGTMSDYFKAKEDELHPVPYDLDMDLASLGEPIGCPMYSVFQSGVQIGDIVAVVGLGFAGQIIAQGAKKRGAKIVIGIDLLDGKLELAKKLGTDITINPQKENIVDIISQLTDKGPKPLGYATDGKGVDVAFEAGGTAESINLATGILRENGILAVYSWCMEPVTLNISRWHDEGIDIRYTCMMHKHPPFERKIWLDRLLKPIKDEIIKIRPLLTKEFPLDNIKEAFEYACNSDEAIKVVIRP